MATALNAFLVVCTITLVLVSYGYAGTVPFYRYWNGRDHFYTTNIHEIGTAIPGHLGKHGYRSEGTAGRIHDTRVWGSVPLYRYWNGREHFYTTNHHEIGTTVPGVTGKHGYKSEGIAGYCFPHQKCGRHDARKPLYRAYNHKSRDHFYTTNVHEMARATSPTAYTFEGIACYIG